MERSATGWTTRAQLVGVLAAALALSSCGLTGPNTSSTKQTTATTRKASTSFPTVSYVPTTVAVTTTLAAINPPAGGNGAGTPGGAGVGSNVDPTPETPGKYTVQAGDVAVLIARRYSITLTELAAANPDKQLERIQPGDTLIIPPPSQGGTQTPPIAPPTQTTVGAARTTTTVAVKTGATYTVQSGDTLVGIAKKLGIQLATLQQLNPGVSASSLQVGQKLNVPKGTAAATTTTKKP